jgi:signal recognition particle subunit SRP54
LDRKEAEATARKMMHEGIDLNDLLEQMRQMKKMGSMKSVLSKLPGVAQQIKDVEIDDRQIDRMEAIILSMTPRERAKPEIINSQRKRRIAAGSGMKVEDVNRLLKGYEQMRKMMKQMKKPGFRKRLAGFGRPF